MRSLIQLKNKNNSKISKQCLNYLSPDFIYIPYPEGASVKAKSKDIINKETILLTKEKTKIYSPVSGQIMGACEMQVGKKLVRTIVIENDFREKTTSIKGTKKYISKYSKEAVLDLVNTFNVYQGAFVGKTLVINGMDNEPGVITSSYIISQYPNEILETIDALCTIFDFHKCFLAIKNNDSENVETLVNHIGTYPNISLQLMPDLYPLGHKDILIKELVLPRKLKEGVIYLTAEELYAIYSVLKKGRPITEKYVTIAGDMIENPAIVKVKIGTSLKDIIVSNFKLIQEDYQIVINGLMGGYEVNNLDFVITTDTNSIFINSINLIPEQSCINCGLCHAKCPVGCDPRTKKLAGCIKCGACSYVCPAKINFKERMVK